ncbi:cathepsin D [Drosophila sulfurigaster albostrigata]|uniref:cathepsin D n=1 Tax=Drosophila sulfurigaster albostrigata TaxID=89887 RepID=UPI002D21A2F9|nr:cathepsin D [Drosophila sulfurigaster albostrigata]
MFQFLSLLFCELLILFLTTVGSRMQQGSLKVSEKSMVSQRSPSFSGSGVIQISLNTRDNVEYYGCVGMGTPPQIFNVLFDTGSANTWLPSSNCLTINSACQLHSRYNANMSSSHRRIGRNFTSVYGNGNVSGYLSQDTLLLDGVELSGLIFGETLLHYQPTFVNTKFDGIVGLGFGQLAWKDSIPFFQLLCQQNHIKKCLFSVYLRRTTGDNYGGNIKFGTIDADKYKGVLHYVSLLDTGYWQFKMSGVFVGSKQIEDNVNAILDTGTSLILVPHRVFDKLHEAIGAKVENNSYVLSCERTQLPNVDLRIGGKIYSISSINYIVEFETLNTKMCTSAFIPVSLEFWVLGNIFLTLFYSVYDAENKRIGLAEVVGESN